MPAIGPEEAEVVVVWEMPFAEAAQAGFGGWGHLGGTSSKMTAREAAEAFRRFYSAVDEVASITPPRLCMIRLDTARQSIATYAAAQGIDFNTVVTNASRHFVSPEIIRRDQLLSGEELERLFDDDQRAFDR
jgi:hypothetical protein